MIDKTCGGRARVDTPFNYEDRLVKKRVLEGTHVDAEEADMPDPRFAFSNFQPCKIVGKDGIVYPSVEHFYVAMKTGDLEVRAHIATLGAGAAKRYGRTVELRPGWEEMKLRVMLFGLRQKFASGSPYAAQLLVHTDQLVEWNTWHDQYWGRCTCSRHNGAGENRLGELLSFVRQELMSTASIFSHP